ncbi:MAG: DarT ssDNA thymidine ADP-ribosyltransferase family protein [Candidatus Omnitrophica bacterium]|nr:DarT ssDNA thymidine ADP-ribosyltransferase family protein [Candidatus Omnitrophota bacterium]
MLKLRGLYYITHIDNIPSILKRGILCHRLVEKEKIQFTPIYDANIVSNRKNILLPDGRSLWDFANLYFQPRNAMLYRVLFFIFSGVKTEDIAIIGLKSTILDRDDILVTTGNAVSPNTQILFGKEAKKEIKNIRKKVDREWWAFEDGSKRELMAECLVPDKVSPDYISEIYVPNHESLRKLQSKIGVNIPIIPEPELFFLPSRKIELTENLSLVEGDMFFSRMQTLTISVNTVGVMGKGLASRAKYQFPDVYVKYQDLCKNKTLKMGKPYLYKRETSLDYILADESERLTNLNLQTWFLLFPTKTDWRKMADLNGIEEGLKWLVSNYKKEGIKSLAIPALGCGLGWLEWGVVGPRLCSYLKKLDIPVQLYLPLERKISDEQLSKEFLLG